MAFTFDPVFAVDPNNPANVAKGASITIFDPADQAQAPIAITDPTGSPLPNPITVDAAGMGPAYQHPTLARVGWKGAGFTGYFTSYEGMFNETVAAKEAAQQAVTDAVDAAQTELSERIAAGHFKGEKGADGSNVLPTDTAIKEAIENTASGTRAAFDAAVLTVGDARYAGRGRLGNKFAYIGDSITIAAEWPVQTPISGNGGSVGGSWPSLAAALSGGKIGHARNAGIAGNNSTQMLARFDTDVAPYKPSVVHISSGVNDAFQALSDDTYKGNIRALVAKVKSIGAVPTLQTMTAVTSAGAEQRARYSRWNNWLLGYAAQNGILIMDAHTLLVDPANGNLAAAYDSGDGTHPNENGRIALANAYVNMVTPLIATQPTPGAMWNTDPLNLVTNGMFLGTPSAGGVAPSWGVYGTPSAGTFTRSVVTDANVRGGKAQRLSVSGATGGNAINQYLNTGFTAGNKVRASVVATSTGGTRAQLQLAFFRNGYSNIGYITRFTDQAFTRGVLELEATVPADCVGIEFIIQTTNSGTGTVDFANASLRNLTAEGNATI